MTTFDVRLELEQILTTVRSLRDVRLEDIDTSEWPMQVVDVRGEKKFLIEVINFDICTARRTRTSDRSTGRDRTEDWQYAIVSTGGWGWVDKKFLVPGTVFRAPNRNPATMLVVAVEYRCGQNGEVIHTLGEPFGGFVSAFGHNVTDIAFITANGAIEHIVEVNSTDRMYYVDLSTVPEDAFR